MRASAVAPPREKHSQNGAGRLPKKAGWDGTPTFRGKFLEQGWEWWWQKKGEKEARHCRRYESGAPVVL